MKVTKTNRRQFFNNIALAAGATAITMPGIVGIMKRDPGIWRQLDNGLWTLNKHDIGNRPLLSAGCTILSRTISSVEDKRIVVSNSQFARPLPSSLSWTSLRIGIRTIMTNTGANLTSTPRLAFGVCSGTTNLFQDASTTNFIGSYSSTASWTYGTSSIANYSGFAQDVTKKVNTTITSGNNLNSSGHYFPADATTANRTHSYLDITKGSPNYSARSFERSNANSSDVTLTEFLDTIVLSTPSASNHTFQTAQTVACDEVAGTFNAVTFAWNRSVAVIEICDLAIVKLA